MIFTKYGDWNGVRHCWMDHSIHSSVPRTYVTIVIIIVEWFDGPRTHTN